MSAAATGAIPADHELVAQSDMIRMPTEKLMFSLLERAGRPLSFKHLVDLIMKARNVSDMPFISIDTPAVGATVAALHGLNRKTVLILGGEGKGQDFSPLRQPAGEFARRVLLIGRDAALIETALAGLPVETCPSLENAVQRAAQIARPGEAVLLSPACASFDMFRDYRHRGEAFAAAVRSLPA